MISGHRGETSWLSGAAALPADGVTASDPGLSAAGSMHRASTVAWVGTCILVLAAPFEGRNPLLTLPLQELSSVELALLAVVGGWLASIAWARVLPRWRT